MSYRFQSRSSKYNLLVAMCFLLVCSPIETTSFEHELSVIRGITDQFTKPNCSKAGPCSCKDFGAVHSTSDPHLCQCKRGDETFGMREAGSSHDKCVQNDRFALSIDKNHSFLVYPKPFSKLCMHPLDHSHYVTASSSCHVSDAKKHWIWTKDAQLLHLYTLKCLQRSNNHIKISGISDSFPKLFLKPCNASDRQQLWQCKGPWLFSSIYDDLNMNFGNVYTYVILFNGRGIYSWWRRFRSNTTLCSHVSSYSGCYKYTDGSSMFIIETNDLQGKYESCMSDCHSEKHVEAPIEKTNRQCSIEWNMTQVWDYGEWKPFLIDGKVFILAKSDDGEQPLTLKVDLTEVSPKLHGQIIKLYIRCVNDGHQNVGFMDHTERDVGETHCVLIKFSGKFNSLFTPIHNTDSPLGTDPTGAKANSTDPAREDTNTENSSLVIIIVVVCLVVILLVIGSIIAYIILKRKRRKNTENSRTETRAVVGKAPSANAAESLNPIYGAEDDGLVTQGPLCDTSETYQEPDVKGKSECLLYEPGGDNVYYYAKPDGDKGRPDEQKPDEGYNYDYATSDDVNQMAKQSPPIYENNRNL